MVKPQKVTVQEIIKGKYHDYDTFLGVEAAQFLKLYIERRKKGVGRIPPETLTPEAPLICDKNTAEEVKPIGPKQLRLKLMPSTKKQGYSNKKEDACSA